MTESRRRPLILGGQRVARGETADIPLEVSQTSLGLPVAVPVRVIRGTASGPRVFVAGAVHGDELNGPGIIRDLMLRRIELKRGALILVPVVNVFGFERNSRYLPDRRDLNRSFPGDPGGSLAFRLANTLFREIVERCDYGIDLHTGAVGRTNFPHVRGDLRQPAVRRLAEQFGCELLMDRPGDEQSLRRVATNHGCPTITLEAGEALRIDKRYVELGSRCVQNVLRHLGMLEGVPLEPRFRATINRAAWARAHVGGMVRMNVSPGSLVEHGSTIAWCDSFFHRKSPVLESPFAGVVLATSTLPVVRPGAPTCHIGVPDCPLEQLAALAGPAKGGRFPALVARGPV